MDDPSGVFDVAHDTTKLLMNRLGPDRGAAPAQPDPVVTSRRALARLNDLLMLQLHELGRSAHGLALVGRAVLETWITGHGALLLDRDGLAALQSRSAHLQAQLTGRTDAAPGQEAHPGPSLMDLARLLDSAMYGSVDPPRAFQRHVMSFYDEVDVSCVEGTLGLFDDHAERAATATQEDHLRVTLWVVLFLAHDHFAAADEPEAARAARALFDRLRAATDEFYAQRRAASRSSSE